MKTLLSVRLVTALLLAASSFPLPAADGSKKTSTIGAKLLQGRPDETAEQRTVRHEREFNEAKTKMNDLDKDLPLLTAPGWEAKEKTFRTELAKLKDDPAFKRAPASVDQFEPVQRLTAKPKAQLQAERRDADVSLMRRQADKVLETHPELRDYVEQRFQWHLRIFAVVGKYSGNPKVLELAQHRLDGRPEVRLGN